MVCTDCTGVGLKRQWNLYTLVFIYFYFFGNIHLGLVYKVYQLLSALVSFKELCLYCGGVAMACWLSPTHE